MRKITIKEAAEKLNIAQTTLREGLYQGRFPFGTGFYNEGSTIRTFVIYPEKFKEYIGEVENENG